ncbi:uncharacterized protein TNIN_222041, partial [Trichonephila inaurata madagascariensis]
MLWLWETRGDKVQVLYLQPQLLTKNRRSNQSHQCLLNSDQ